MSDAPEQADKLGDRLISLFWWGRPPAVNVAERTRRRVTVHLIPVLFFLYILAYLDRVNISVASLGMELSPEKRGLGYDREIIGTAAGIFFWGYWILEIPSTLSVVRFGARYVFCRILILWGVCATLMGFIGMPLLGKLFGWIPDLPVEAGVFSGITHFVNSLETDALTQFYFLRFMLGFFEGGFFPSVIVYLSLWFRGEDRAKAIAFFMAAIPLSSAFGLPASGLLLGINWLDVAGWRWIFIIEGILPVLAGVAVLFFLPDRPQTARWLPADERDWLTSELLRESQSKQGHGHWEWVHHLGMVLLLTGVYFCLNVSSYGLGMFMPAIIKSQSGYSSQNASYLATLPYLMALIGMLLNGWHSDRTGERIWHVAVPLCVLSLALFLTAGVDGQGKLPVLVMIFLAGTCLYAHLPAFWPIPTVFLGATAAASAIGFINMIGNLGGSYGPYLVGKAAKDQVSFAPALIKIAPWPMVAAAIILTVGYARRSRQKRAAPKNE